MSVIVTERDDGTKKKMLDALKKTKRDFKRGEDVRAELDRIWNKIRQDAYNFCPKRRGLLAGTIRVTSMPTGTMMGAWSRVKAVQIFNKTIIAGDLTKGVDYASWVHDGHKLRDGRMYDGVPFLTQAIAYNEADLEKAIQRALKKLGKKFERY